MGKTLSFGDISVPVPGFGVMGMSGVFGTKLDDNTAEPVFLKALELGCTFWDTASVYGMGGNEKLLGSFLRKHDARDKVFLASKCGFEVNFETGERKGVTNSAEHIKRFIDGSLERLQTDHVDLYYLHRIDPKTPLEESIGALDEIRKAGKTRYIGLSECSAATLRKAHKIAKIDAVQAEYSLFETLHETDALIDTCRELGVAYVAFAPLGYGMLTGDLTHPEQFSKDDYRRTSPKFQGENFYKNLELVNKVKALAKAKDVTPAQLAIGWLISQKVIPIPGTTNVGRLEENFGAGQVDFTEAELAELRHLVDNTKPAGNRFNDMLQSMVGH